MDHWRKMVYRWFLVNKMKVQVVNYKAQASIIEHGERVHKYIPLGWQQYFLSKYAVNK